MKKLLLLSTAIVTLAAPAEAGPVAGIVTWAAGVLAGGGLGALALSTALSMGINAISTALYKSQQPEQEIKVTQQVTMGDTLPLTFIVGDYSTAGQRKYIGSWGKNTRFITEVIEVSALPQGFDKVWVNDEPGVFVEGGVRAYVDGGSAPGSVKGWSEEIDPDSNKIDMGRPLTNMSDDGSRITIKWVNGTQEAADPFLVWAFGEDPDYPWTSNMIGKGKSYAIMTTRYDSETVTSYPKFLFKPQPLAVYDLREDSTAGGSGTQRWADPSTWKPSTNAAVIAYTIARGIYYGSEWVYGGRNLASWRLPAAEWMAAANACDASAPLAGGQSEPYYRAGLEIRVDSQAANILEEIGKAANMNYAEVGGRLKPLVDLPGAAVMSISDADILITASQSFRPFYTNQNTYNTINATYPEPAERWTMKDAPRYQDAKALADDKGNYRAVGLTFSAAPYKFQVQRLMRSQMRNYRRMRSHSFYLPPGAYRLEPMIDRISWTSNRNGYINKAFIVERVVKTPGMNVLVEIREIDPSDYDWSSDFQKPVTITPPKNPVPFIQPVPGFYVEGFALPGQNGQPRRPAIKFGCAEGEEGVTDIQVQARILNQAVSVDTTRKYGPPYNWLLLNVLPATEYQVRARLLSDWTPKSQWTAWHNVNTPNVKLSLDDVDIDSQIIQDLENFQNWMNDTDQLLADLQSQINADITRVEGLIQNSNDLLDAEVLRLEQDIADAVGISKAYVDTEILAEQVIRQGETDALAARIDQLTAALVSEDLITDGNFLNGLAAWTVVTPTVTIVAKDPGSSQPVVANMPAPASAMMTFGSAIKQTTENFTVTADDALQLRLRAAGSGGSRNLDITVQWKTADGTNIGTAETQRVSVTGGSVWQKLAARFLPPNTTAKLAEITYRHTSASGSNLYITDLEATLINVAIEARVAELEAAQVTTNAAIATNKQEITTKFNENKAAITAEATARSDADSAMGRRIDTIETDTGANKASITTIQNTLTTLEESVASSVETITAITGSAEKIKDGVFSQGFKYWGGTIGSALIAQADPTSANWYTAEAPTKNILFADGGGRATGSITSERFPVSPDQAFDFSFMYARHSPNSITPIMRVRWIKPDGNWVLQEVARGTGQGSWLRAVGLNIKAPTGTAQGQVQFLFEDNQWSARVALLSARLRQPFEEQASAEIESAKYALTDPNGALAILTNTVTSNYNSLDGRVKSNATAISQRYTKSQTDQAISAGIDEYNATLTNILNQKASAQALTALTTRVKNTEDGLVAQSNSIDKVQAQTDRGTASGLLRIAASSGPAGVRSRIGLRAEVTSGSSTEGAAFFLDARTDGVNQAVFGVGRFAIVNGMTPTGIPVVPFKVEGGIVYIDMARIKDLSVDRIKIANGAVTNFEFSRSAGPVADHQLIYNTARPGPQIIHISCVGNGSGVTGTNPINRFSLRIVRTVNGVSTIIWRDDDIINNVYSTSIVDQVNISGRVQYGLEIRPSGGSTSASMNAAFLGVLNVHK